MYILQVPGVNKQTKKFTHEKVESQADIILKTIKILSLKRNSCIEKRIFFFKERTKSRYLQVTRYNLHIYNLYSIQFNDTQKLRTKCWKRVNSTDDEIKLELQLCSNVRRKEKNIDKEGHCVMIKGTVH